MKDGKDCWPWAVSCGLEAGIQYPLAGEESCGGSVAFLPGKPEGGGVDVVLKKKQPVAGISIFY